MQWASMQAPLLWPMLSSLGPAFLQQLLMLTLLLLLLLGPSLLLLVMAQSLLLGIKCLGTFLTAIRSASEMKGSQMTTLM